MTQERCRDGVTEITHWTGKGATYYVRGVDTDSNQPVLIPFLDTSHGIDPANVATALAMMMNPQELKEFALTLTHPRP